MVIRVGSKTNRRDSGADPFSDLLFNSLLGISLLFFIAIIFINPKTKAGDVEFNAYFVITVSWKDYSPDDIDVWVADPLGKKLWFKQREIGLLHLDRDDRGMEDDQITVNNQLVENPLNQEVVTIRGVYPGRYTVNLHYYKSISNEPVDVEVRIFKLRPSYQSILNETITLAEKGAEKTAINFTIGPAGEIVEKDKTQKQLVVFRK